MRYLRIHDTIVPISRKADGKDTLIPDFSGINDPRFSISLENTGEK